MQGVFVAVVPILLAGFALLMDRFESRILAQPEKVDPPRKSAVASAAATDTAVTEGNTAS